MANIQKKATLSCLSCTALALSFPAMAEVNFSLNLESTYTDNADRMFIGTVSERQDRLSLITDIDYQNSWLTSNIDYQITQLLFDKDTQEDRLELDGEANLLFGQENGRFNVTLNNTKRQVLSSPGELALADNFQTRDITTVQPRLNIFQNQADIFYITGTYRLVNFDENESQQPSFDTTNEGLELAWARRISKVDTVTLSIQHLDIGFDDLSNSDFQYQSALIRYTTKLRQLSYSIAAGYNTSEPDAGPDNSSPQWEISVEYDGGANRLSFLSEGFQTDTSRGNQNNLLSGAQSPLSLGNGVTTIADTYDRKAHTLSWSNSSLCNRCELTLTGSISSESYNQQTDQNSDQVLAFMRGNYRLDRRSGLSLSYRYQKVDFDTAGSGNSFNSDTYGLSYDRQLSENFTVRLSAEQIERSGDTNADSYDETSISAAFNYRFR